ncbi:PDZ domain-containing protein [Aeoliella sp. SH292]|uniref:PDZ domain-containing protein n=1 Tax=Aeoliella sp. SH292 TaxID=3454464 RepID=UPI003F9C12F4
MKLAAFQLGVGLAALAIFTTVSRGEEAAPATALAVVDAEHLAAWSRDLDSRKFAIREAATDHLLAAGPVALPYLATSLDSESLEVADRAAWVLKQMSLSKDSELQIAALELLAGNKRFPAMVRDAEVSLADIYEELCRQKLEVLGAAFEVSSESITALTIGVEVKVSINREEWLGKPSDLLELTKLRQIAALKVAAHGLDNKVARKLAEIPGLQVLELIETDANMELVDELRKARPELRVRLKSRAMLGVGLMDGSPPTVSQVHVNTPAAFAGFREGDAILKFEGAEVDSFDTLTNHIGQHDPGDTVKIVVQRGEEEVELSAKLTDADWMSDTPLNER